ATGTAPVLDFGGASCPVTGIVKQAVASDRRIKTQRLKLLAQYLATAGDENDSRFLIAECRFTWLDAVVSSEKVASLMGIISD
ncbi:MAG TPA: hypothetical protein PK529_13170, partial [Verrucomicrobiales bacterium]|nr:hypothetical protein [Verrucomicrobiales bacterium]